MFNLDKTASFFPELPGLPSWVVPGTIAENACFLHKKTDCIFLCLFELESCLNYDTKDLPPELALLDFTWHAHLPLDLDWTKGARAVAENCLRLRDKLLFLKPDSFTLHPPRDVDDPRYLLESFSRIWHEKNGGRLFLENTSSYDCGLLNLEFLENTQYSFCLDTGHARAFNQDCLLSSDLPEKAGMVHWNVCDKTGRHFGLNKLSDRELDLYKNLALRLSPEIIHILEIFNWNHIMDSMPLLREILTKRSLT